MMEDDVLQTLEEQSRARQASVRALLAEAGRPDLIEELERNLRDVRTGVSSARGTWHALSPVQRRVVQALAAGYWLRRSPGSRTRYDAVGVPDAIGSICDIRTVRNLTSRELLACDGGVFDPEAKLVITETGRFVEKHGPVPSS